MYEAKDSPWLDCVHGGVEVCPLCNIRRMECMEPEDIPMAILHRKSMFAHNQAHDLLAELFLAKGIGDIWPFWEKHLKAEADRRLMESVDAYRREPAKPFSRYHGHKQEGLH